METRNTGMIASLLDKGKLFLKAVIIFIMALGLWIPTFFVKEVIHEREGRQREAIADISSKWADEQTITGPILRIPYFEDAKDEKGNAVLIKRNAFFLANETDVSATIIPEKRHRGIYQVVVYRSSISISGKFNPLRWENLKIPGERIVWNEAALLFHITDNLKGVNDDIYVSWDGADTIFNPQQAGESAMKDALSAAVSFSQNDAAKPHAFRMQFALNGSEKLLFSASARESRITMKSEWPDPSFTGIKLPDVRQVSDSGFTAQWKFLNRAVPMVWKDYVYDLSEASFGADLIIPVDGYDKTERSIKYALLCIILTFAAFFLIESIYKKPLHLIQYGLAGLALVLFYTLLLSISEYLGFNTAYLISGAATIGLVTWFVGSIMKSPKLGVFIGFVLMVVYGYIFSIIQLQDYALLMGSIGLFVALGIIMYFSRKLQW